MPQWIKNLAPDVAKTLARFPLAIILSFLSTILTIYLINRTPDKLEEWFLLVAGLSIGAVFAVAGVLYGESKQTKGLGYAILAVVLPLAIIALLQVKSNNWVIALMSAPISLLWLSLAAFTDFGRGQSRIEIQNKFWWLNHRAITTAVIAGAGFALVSLGMTAIERAMAMLFGLKSDKLFYEILLPFTWFFLTPLYWLSTIPKLDDYQESEISEPDFLSRAIGFLGQFILTPFLFIYALILLAYAAQIVVTQTLPQGTLSWMVLGFTIVGAANWLVLHPDFMHERPLVKYFRKTWFWLTLIPAALYITGVFVRIDAYGFTAERVGLVAGGLWIIVLATAFISKKFADIRLIPGLALLLAIFFSVGPWNFVNGPQLHQAERLDAAIHNATPTNQTLGGPYTWTKESADVVRGSLRYLINADRENPSLQAVLTRHDIEFNPDNPRQTAILKALNIPDVVVEASSDDWMRLHTLTHKPIDLTDTPFFLGRVALYSSDPDIDIAHLNLKIIDWSLRVEGPSHVVKNL